MIRFRRIGIVMASLAIGRMANPNSTQPSRHREISGTRL